MKEHGRREQSQGTRVVPLETRRLVALPSAKRMHLHLLGCLPRMTRRRTVGTMVGELVLAAGVFCRSYSRATAPGPRHSGQVIREFHMLSGAVCTVGACPRACLHGLSGRRETRRAGCLTGPMVVRVWQQVRAGT